MGGRCFVVRAHQAEEDLIGLLVLAMPGIWSSISRPLYSLQLDRAGDWRPPKREPALHASDLARPADIRYAQCERGDTDQHGDHG